MIVYMIFLYPKISLLQAIFMKDTATSLLNRFKEQKRSKKS